MIHANIRHIQTSDNRPLVRRPVADASREKSMNSNRTLPDCMQQGVPVHAAEELTRGGAVAHITLGGQLYVLRITRAGKLILTK